MPIVIILDTSLSMLRRPQPDSSFTYFEVAQTLIESVVSYVRRHHFTEHLALVTASSQPQVRAAFSRRDGYASLMQEVLGVSVEDKADYVRSIAVAHNAALAEFGANDGITTNFLFFTDEGSLLHGIPEKGEKVTEGLPFLFPGNLFMISLQGRPERSRSPFKRLVDLNDGRGRVIHLPCATSVPSEAARIQWPLLLPAHYGQLRCGWLHADVQSHPPIRSAPPGRFTVKVAGFVTPDDVSSPAVSSRHLLLPVVQKTTAENGSPSAENGEAEAEVHWYPCGTTEEHWKAPQFTALLHGSLASRHFIALAEFLPASPQPAGQRRFALLHSELASPTAAKRSNLTLSLLSPGIDVMPWMGKLSYLAPVADFEVPPGSPFPVKSLEPRSYSSGSGHVCWLWGNMALDVSKVMKHARHLSSASANRVKAFYADVNRVRTAALAFGATSLLVAIRNILEREVQHAQDSTTKSHLGHVLSNLLVPIDQLKKIEEPSG